MPYDNEDEGPREDTARHRRARSDAERPDWHDRLVEHFGASGTGGEWSRFVKTVDAHSAVLEDLKAWKWKLLGMASLGGIIAGVLAWLIPQLIGKH